MSPRTAARQGPSTTKKSALLPEGSGDRSQHRQPQGERQRVASSCRSRRPLSPPAPRRRDRLPSPPLGRAGVAAGRPSRSLRQGNGLRPGGRGRRPLLCLPFAAGAAGTASRPPHPGNGKRRPAAGSRPRLRPAGRLLARGRPPLSAALRGGAGRGGARPAGRGGPGPSSAPAAQGPAPRREGRWRRRAGGVPWCRCWPPAGGGSRCGWGPARCCCRWVRGGGGRRSGEARRQGGGPAGNASVFSADPRGGLQEAGRQPRRVRPEVSLTAEPPPPCWAGGAGRPGPGPAGGRAAGGRGPARGCSPRPGGAGPSAAQPPAAAASSSSSARRTPGARGLAPGGGALPKGVPRGLLRRRAWGPGPAGTRGGLAGGCPKGARGPSGCAPRSVLVLVLATATWGLRGSARGRYSQSSLGREGSTRCRPYCSPAELLCSN